MLGFSIGSVQKYDQSAYRSMSRQLDLLAQGDFSPVADEIQRKFKDTDLDVRAIPFVQRYVAELSGMYAKPVVRRFQPNSLATAEWQKLQAVYSASRVDRALYEFEQGLWIQNCAIAIVMPAGLDRVHIAHINPWQVEQIDSDDAMRADDPATWTKFLALVPASSRDNTVTFQQMELTRTHAWRYIDGVKVGVYAADGSHPFKRVPVQVVHRVDPDEGRALPAINEAVLNLQLALSLQDADNELIVRACAWPQKVIENAEIGQQVESVSLGPDKIFSLTKSDALSAVGPKLAIVQGQVPVTELVTFAEHKIRMYCTMLGLDASNFLRVNTAVTTSARLYSAQDRQAQRDKIIPCLDELEAGLLRDIVDVLNLNAVLRLPRNLGVEVTRNAVDPSPDRQSDAQALDAEVKLGISSPVDVVAARDNIGRTEALRKVQTNLDEARALGLIAPAMGAPADHADTAGQATTEGDPVATGGA